ncbi:hypothetical protein BK120_21200 [Paenibacillus sp. FSL A5-0031]|nr:hypothetical protein BK120_21200 [Paenibacillus sp. FSL A5-0031]
MYALTFYNLVIQDTNCLVWKEKFLWIGGTDFTLFETGQVMHCTASKNNRQTMKGERFIKIYKR